MIEDASKEIPLFFTTNYSMGVAILIEAVICGGSYLLFRYTEWGALMIIILLFVLLMAMTAGAYLLCTCRGTRNMDEFTV